MASRALPSDIEAEMSVLGVSFLNKESLEKISDEVTEDMFYSDKNRTIFKAIINLYKNYIFHIKSQKIEYIKYYIILISPLLFF